MCHGGDCSHKRTVVDCVRQRPPSERALDTFTVREQHGGRESTATATTGDVFWHSFRDRFRFLLRLWLWFGLRASWWHALFHAVPCHHNTAGIRRFSRCCRSLCCIAVDCFLAQSQGAQQPRAFFRKLLRLALGLFDQLLHGVIRTRQFHHSLQVLLSAQPGAPTEIREQLLVSAICALLEDDCAQLHQAFRLGVSDIARHTTCRDSRATAALDGSEKPLPEDLRRGVARQMQLEHAGMGVRHAVVRLPAAVDRERLRRVRREPPTSPAEAEEHFPLQARERLNGAPELRNVRIIRAVAGLIARDLLQRLDAHIRLPRDSALELPPRQQACR